MVEAVGDPAVDDMSAIVGDWRVLIERTPYNSMAVAIGVKPASFQYYVMC